MNIQKIMGERWNAQAVKLEDMSRIAQWVSQVAGVPLEALHPLGSTGKQPVSGDIDIAIESDKYSEEVVTQRLTNALGAAKTFYSDFTGVHSYAVPNGEELAQVDLTFTPHLAWTQFCYHSEGVASGRTQYKGAVRHDLLRSIAYFIDQPGVDYKVYEPNGDLVVNVGRKLDTTQGLIRYYQFRPLRKKKSSSDSPYVKKFESVETIWEVHAQCGFGLPELHIGEIDITDPTEALGLMFPGANLTPDDVRTAEQVYALLQTPIFTPERRQRIMTKAEEKMERLSTKMETIF